MADKEKKETKRPVKNYVILGVLVVASILLVLYLCGWYRAYAKYQMTIPVLRGVVPEIAELEVPHYVQENDAVLLYLGVPSDPSCREFETDLKKLISRKQLKDELTYLNLENEEKATTVLDSLEEQYQTEQLNYYPMFIFFEEGTVKKVLQSKADAPLTISLVEQFLKGIRIGD